MPPPRQQGGHNISSIIFDADGVVVDSERIWDKAQAEFSIQHGIPYERDKIKPLLAGRSQAEAIDILRSGYGLVGSTQSLVQERMELVKREFANGVQFVPGFRDFLQRVQSSFQTCIATSMPEELLAIVDVRLGISALFGGRIFSLAAVGYCSKPHPDIFLHAANQLKVTPAHCLVIEDAPNGIEAARRAGMRCVGLTTTFSRATLREADQVVDSFEEIDLATP